MGCVCSKEHIIFHCVLNAQIILLATAVFDFLVLSEQNIKVAKYSQYSHYCKVENTQNDNLDFLAMAFAHVLRAIAEFLREHILEHASSASPIVV